MVVPGLVIAHHPLLDTLGSHIKGHMDLSVCCLFGGQHSQLQGIQGRPRIPACYIRQKFPGIFLQLHVIAPHSFFHICCSPDQQPADILPLQGLQFKDNGPGNQGTVDLKIGIFRGCTYEYQSSVLHKRQKVILLSFIEAVYLINKENGLLPVHAQIVLGFFHYFLHVLFSRNRCVHLLELGAGGVGNDLCQCCLSRTRRSVEKYTSQFVRLDGTVKQFPFTDDMLLPHHLFQRCGAHPGGQGRLILQSLFFHIIK